MEESVRAFYDQIADHYHLLFADWRASVERQAMVLDQLIRNEIGPGPHAILDCACGIGTQAIGLAWLGHRVHATDLSSAAIARAKREAEAAGVAVSFGVADMRELEAEVSGTFDVVLACDNALPHLLRDADLRMAIANMAGKLRPDGLLLTSIRDYDRLIAHQPRSEQPRVFDDPDGRRITFQIWDWAADGRSYVLHLFILQQLGTEWHTTCASTEYRALQRAELDAALLAAGLERLRWHEPDDSGYYQPIVTARAGDRFRAPAMRRS